MVVKVPGILYKDQSTTIICPFACDNVYHSHGVTKDGKLGAGHKRPHCMWLGPRPWPHNEDSYEIIEATPEQEKIIRDWMPRADHLSTVDFMRAADMERREILQSLIGKEQMPPMIRTKNARGRSLWRSGIVGFYRIRDDGSIRCTFCGEHAAGGRDGVQVCNRLKCVKKFNIVVDRELDAYDAARAAGQDVTPEDFKCEDYL